MGNFYGVDSIGYNFADPYALYGLNSYNPNFRGYQTAPTNVTSQPADTTAVSDTTSVDPSFKGSSIGSARESGISGGTVAGLGAIALGAATLIYASKRGKGEGIKQGFKNIWNGIKGKTSEAAAGASESVAQKISKLIKDGGKNVREYQVANSNVVITRNHNGITQIHPRNNNTLTKPAQINSWRSANGMSAALRPTDADVIFSSLVRGGFKDKSGNIYKIIFDAEGKAIGAISKGKKLDKEVFEQLLKDNPKMLDSVSFTYTMPKAFVNDVERTNVRITRKNGITEVQYTDKDGQNCRATLEALKGSDGKYPDEVTKLIENSTLGSGDYRIYERTVENGTIRFKNDGTVIDVVDRTLAKKPITDKNAIEKYIEKHPELKDIGSNDTLPEGFSIGKVTTNNGNILEIADGKLKKVTTASGNVLENTALENWLKTAANNNEVEAILALLK